MAEQVMNVWLYVLLMLVVIYIGLWIVAGANPLKMFEQIGQVFEPGKLYITNDNPHEGLARFVKLDCSPNAPVVTLDGLKFYYRAKPGSQSDNLKFAVIMDYAGLPGTQRKLIVGHYGENNVEIISCGASGDEFQCPQDIKLRFDMRGIGGLQPKEVFHFTTWLEEPDLLRNAQTYTLKEMLEGHPQAYLSSFDVAVDTGRACGIDTCSRLDNEASCNSETTCYWGGFFPWTKSCSLCLSYSSCDQFSKDACEKCPAALNLNCHETLLGCA